VVELAPPAVEAPLLRGAFAEEMKEQKGMDVKVLAWVSFASGPFVQQPVPDTFHKFSRQAAYFTTHPQDPEGKHHTVEITE
jgi:hypothetical protein